MILIYFKLFLASLLGMGFQLFFKNMNLAETAGKANVDYSFSSFLLKDKKAIIGTALTMGLFFLLFGDIINSIHTNSSDELKPYLWGFLMLSAKTIANILIMVICVTISYTGQDIALRFLGRTSKELREALENYTPTPTPTPTPKK